MKFFLVGCLILIYAFSAIAQTEKKTIIPVPEGYSEIKNTLIRDILFDAEPLPENEKPLMASVPSSDIDIIYGKRFENRAVAISKISVTTKSITRSQFKKENAFMMEDLKRIASNKDVQKIINENMENVKDSYGLDADIKKGRYQLLERDIISENCYIYNDVSYNTHVKSGKFDYYVNYYHCTALIYFKSRMYRVEMHFPIKGEKEAALAKNLMKKWITQFYAKNNKS